MPCLILVTIYLCLWQFEVASLRVRVVHVVHVLVALVKFVNPTSSLEDIGQIGNKFRTENSHRRHSLINSQQNKGIIIIIITTMWFRRRGRSPAIAVAPGSSARSHNEGRGQEHLPYQAAAGQGAAPDHHAVILPPPTLQHCTQSQP